eukprot:TRINITY_DN8611_c0_g1_i1.p1 TRINITY_DN8611_c0_g1~~TRINITY_DN8611_c0_g1_i1.p1  ORF type:complete len:759 (+),score=153.42 TRINITY_DN8611_c0_g1_i1:17-2293(+)
MSEHSLTKIRSVNKFQVGALVSIWFITIMILSPVHCQTDSQNKDKSVGDSEFCSGPNASLDKDCAAYRQETEQLDKDAMNEPEPVNKWSESENTIEENADYNHDVSNDSENIENVEQNEVIEDESQLNNQENLAESQLNQEEIMDDSNPSIDGYKKMFDENGKFNRELIKDELARDEYTDVEQAGIPEGADETQYDHIRTPLYTIRLTSAYEDNLKGSHLQNKYMQKWAMDEFVAGRMKPGEMGNGIVLEDMTIDEDTKKELMFIDHAFAEYISEMISVNRTLPDRRDEWCKLPTSYFTTFDKLPSTSVIICFHNEAWSTLTRSVYSVLSRSPDHLLHEIILVDDASTMEHLHERLEQFVLSTPKVKLIRLSSRQGLVRTRMAGIRAAEAEVLTFLDSHIEATTGWLEPLLDRVARNYKTVATPVIEAIDEKTFQYKFVTMDLMGTFNWRLEFDWSPISDEQQASREHRWAPYNSPTMAGGLFAINKAWFEEIGLYDEGMEIWGGENIEMSFRQWMCGGSIEIVPCSRVGHVFRSWSPYPWRTDINVLTYNPLRVAEVWMDDYRFLYYDRYGRWDKPLQNRVGYFGDVQPRRDLRESLQCNSFQWYLDNVAVDVPQHHLIASGEIFNKDTKQCLDQEDKVDHIGKHVGLHQCHLTGGNQYWMFRTDGKILRDYLCIGSQQNEAKEHDVVLVPCEDHTFWNYDNEKNWLVYNETMTCLTLDHTQVDKLHLAECDEYSSFQKWFFTHMNPGGMQYSDLAG